MVWKNPEALVKRFDFKEVEVEGRKNWKGLGS
jgi:hypothetical protein